MSLVESIIGFSSAYSQAKVRMEVAAKVLKIAQGQNQVAAELVSAAVENVEEMITDLAADLGNQIDVSA